LATRLSAPDTDQVDDRSPPRRGGSMERLFGARHARSGRSADDQFQTPDPDAISTTFPIASPPRYRRCYDQLDGVWRHNVSLVCAETKAGRISSLDPDGSRKQANGPGNTGRWHMHCRVSGRNPKHRALIEIAPHLTAVRGCRSLRSAFASIWRIRSRVMPNSPRLLRVSGIAVLEPEPQHNDPRSRRSFVERLGNLRFQELMRGHSTVGQRTVCDEVARNASPS